MLITVKILYGVIFLHRICSVIFAALISCLMLPFTDSFTIAALYAINSWIESLSRLLSNQCIEVYSPICSSIHTAHPRLFQGDTKLILDVKVSQCLDTWIKCNCTRNTMVKENSQNAPIRKRFSYFDHSSRIFVRYWFWSWDFGFKNLIITDLNLNIFSK